MGLGRAELHKEVALFFDLAHIFPRVGLHSLEEEVEPNMGLIKKQVTEVACPLEIMGIAKVEIPWGASLVVASSFMEVTNIHTKFKAVIVVQEIRSVVASDCYYFYPKDDFQDH
jgi:hypothetical protein